VLRAALALAAVIATTWAGGVSHAATDPWDTLRRPLAIPNLPAGSACPVSTIHQAIDFRSIGLAPGLGPGPVYPIGLRNGTLSIGPPTAFNSRHWGGQKALWFVHQSYQGPVLIRGRQLDGPYRVRFDRGGTPPKEVRIASGETVAWVGQPDGSRGRPSNTRVRTPGCYGYQVDGADFSRVIVFRAVRGS
jgi:hypothetical protein